MYRYGLVILLFLLLGSAGLVGAQEAVSLSSRSLYPNIQDALDDGFYSLSEQLARGVLRAEPTVDQAHEATLLLAHALWGQKRYSEMLALLKGFDGDGDFVYWRARALFELKQFANALEVLTGASELVSGSAYAPEALRLRGAMERETQQLAKAEASFRQFGALFGEHPQRMENQFDLGEVLAAQLRMDEALSIYDALEKESSPALVQRARLTRGHLLHTQGDAADLGAARMLLGELGTNTQVQVGYRIDAYVELAVLEEREGRPEASVAALRQGIALSRSAHQRVPLRLELARLLLRQDDTEGALKLLEACRAEAPNQNMATELQLEKAMALLQAKRFEQAIEAIQIYLAVADDPRGLAQAQLGKGGALLALNRFVEAATALDKASAGPLSSERQGDALFKAGDAYYQAGQYAQAEKRYHLFVTEFPAHKNGPNALYQEGLSLSGQGKRSAALHVFQALEKEHKESLFAEKAALRTADLFRSNRRWDAALDKFTQINQVYTNSPETQAFSEHQRGQVLYRLGRYTEAQQAFEAVLEQHPGSEYVPQATYLRGFCLTALGEVDEGIQTCTNFIEKYPDSEWTPEVIFWLAEYYFNLGSYTEAEPLFLRISTEFEASRLAPRALYWAGRAAAVQSDYMAALERYSAVTKRYPSSGIVPQIRFAQGDALTEQGEFERAILAYDEVVKNYPESRLVNAAWGRKGDCQFSLAMDHPASYAEAMGSYQAILDRPTAPLSLKLQAEYKIGRCLEKMGRVDGAFSRYMSVVYTFKNESVPHSVQNVMWFTRSAFGAAVLKERSQAWVEAVQVYGRVIEVDVPAKDEALKRRDKIKKENGLLFSLPVEKTD